MAKEFIGSPAGASPEPFKYYATFTDQNGKSGAETIIPSEDPAKDTSLTAQEAADKVKEHLIEVRGDYYNRGITWDKLTVVQGPRQDAADKKKIGEILSSMPPVKLNAAGEAITGAPVKR